MKKDYSKIIIVSIIVIFFAVKIFLYFYNFNEPYEIILKEPKKDIPTGEYTTNAAELKKTTIFLGIFILIVAIWLFIEKIKHKKDF